MSNIKNDKKAVELSLQTIVVFIIVVIVILVMVFFFSTHFNSGSQSIVDIGGEAIKAI